MTASLIKFSVHKITILFFKSKSKYEISTHSLPRWRKLKELLDASSSPFLLFLYARLTRNWLHFEQPSSYSRYIWSSLTRSNSWQDRNRRTTVSIPARALYRGVVCPMFFFGGGGARAVFFRQTQELALSELALGGPACIHHEDSDNINTFPTRLNNRGGGHPPGHGATGPVAFFHS